MVDQDDAEEVKATRPKGAVPVDRLRAVLRLLDGQDITEMGRRQIEKVIREYE